MAEASRTMRAWRGSFETFRDQIFHFHRNQPENPQGCLLFWSETGRFMKICAADSQVIPACWAIMNDASTKITPVLY
ncbi:hypothetical protein [Brucella suis]|uniref:hypothetical protein n=1 Tax=Brucella suis TaxID=29461 RepID=UPI0001BA0EDC|nr:hypothetical protein [Brucella suis]EEY27695.1 predicted protein [Brucella suis bv. 5 str. 513]QOK68075.1 hypothetical protein HUZ31_14355 [Brucella suis bv. 5]